jgi:putative ATP-dependent endonuclease of OLD family
MCEGMLVYLANLSIDGFKCFSDRFQIAFAEGLNVLVGENGSGKSAIVDAIRLLLQGDDPGRADITDVSFHRPFGEGAQPVDRMMIAARFAGLTAEEQIAFLPWTDLGPDATLTLQVENKLTARGRYKRSLWGGRSSASIFEGELVEAVACAYLPPLRDAEGRLREGRGSRLARFLRNLSGPEGEEGRTDSGQQTLTQRVTDFHRELASDSAGLISRANELIRARLRDAIGEVFGQDTAIRFSETNFSRIVESLRLLFFPRLNGAVTADAFRSLEENSLGYNNLLYLATVLAELAQTGDEGSGYLRVLLIEEPEAHLHPQLQTRLLKFLEAEASRDKLQVIVTTHSPVLASAASISSMIHVSRHLTYHEAVQLSDCGLAASSNSFLTRWLDVTKSTLLFARGVILVEGIAEALLLPELARRVLREYSDEHAAGSLPLSLEDAGISVVNMNGVYFEHFMQLFCDLSGQHHRHPQVRCAGITDRDPRAREAPTWARPYKGRNPALHLVDTVRSSPNCRLYVCGLKTFEYDLAMEGANLQTMSSVLSGVLGSPGGQAGGPAHQPEEQDAVDGSDDARARAALRLLRRIANDSKVGKGFFSQALAGKLASQPSLPFAVPAYIRHAVLWALGASDE